MRLLPVVTAVALVALGALSGCDDDVLAQDDDVDPSTETVRAGLVDLYAGTDPTYEATTEGQCFADALLERVPLDDLVRAGIVGDDGRVPPLTPVLDVDVAGAWVDAAASCASYAVVAARSWAARTGAGLEIEHAYAGCLSRAMDPGRARRALVATLTGGYTTDPAVADLLAAEEACQRRVVSGSGGNRG